MFANDDVLSCRYLYGFEEYCTSTAITFRMDLPLKQAPKAEVKPEAEVEATVLAASSSGEDQKAQLDMEPAVCKVHLLLTCQSSHPNATNMLSFSSMSLSYVSYPKKSFHLLFLQTPYLSVILKASLHPSPTGGENRFDKEQNGVRIGKGWRQEQR